MNKKLVAAVSVAALLVLPLAALADLPPVQAPAPNITLSPIGIVNVVLNFLWPIFIGVAVLMFLIAAFMFLFARGNAEQVAAARQALLWGVIGIVVGILAFSIPFVIRNVSGLNT